MTLLVWTSLLAALGGAAASLEFYRRTGSPLPPETADLVRERAPDLRRLASGLGGRPTWIFDLGMVSGGTFCILGIWTGGAALALAAAGAFLALLSLSGRLLVLGGRRRLRQILEVVE